MQSYRARAGEKIEILQEKHNFIFFYSFIYDFILSGIMVVIMDARACSHSAHAPGDNLARTGEDQTNHAILYENFILFYFICGMNWQTRIGFDYLNLSVFFYFILKTLFNFFKFFFHC